MGSNRIILFERTDNLIQLGAIEPLTDNTDGSVITGATVRADFHDSDGILRDSVTLSHVSGGLYRGLLSLTDNPVKTGEAGSRGTIRWFVNAGADKEGFWESDFITMKRRE